MVSETDDVQSFIARHPPFNQLSDSQLEFASSSVYVAFSKSGSELDFSKSDDDHPVGILIVRSGSLEVRTVQGVLIDRLSSGDYLVPEVLYAKQNDNPKIIVLEDCLYYELTKYAFQSLLAGNPEMAALCDLDKTKSSSDTESQLHSNISRITEDTYLNQYVKDTMSTNVVCVDQSKTIQQAAQLMAEHRISSLLISSEQKLAGIITDRDFRTRVLSKGIAYTETLENVMTKNPMCMDVNSRLHDAQLKMMSEGIHHLPIVENGKPIGVISLSDILRANNIEPLSLIKDVSCATSVDELSRASRGVPDLVVKLIERDARAVEVGEIITSLADAMTRRLLELAEEKYGKPPCDYAWLAFGSQARQEQVLGSDQDNGLLFPDGISEDELQYFQAFSDFVNAGLNACGMPFCPGDIMAKNSKWRMSLTGWKQCFTRWIEEPSPKALMHSSIFFDMRHIAGNSNLTDALQDYMLKKAQSNTIFLALMCENSLLHSPPLGFFKTFVLESDGDHNQTLDLKKRGTIPIVDAARNFALSVGLRPLNTIKRLQEIEQAGAMSKEMAYSLIDAHEFIAGIRLAAQAREYRAEEEVDNYLDPKELSPLVRHQLKDAFNLVRDAQNAMKMRFSGGAI